MSWLLDILKWFEKGWQYHKRPKLRIYFYPAEAYLIRPVVDAGNVLGFFCHLMVSNEGKEVARNCRARVIDVSVPSQNGSDFSRHPLFSNPFVLKWAHEDYDPKDIENDLPRPLDLCYWLQSIPNNLFFSTPQKPNGNQTIYPTGLYYVKVRVDSDNAKAVDKSFQVHFEGGWNQITISDNSE